MPYENINAQLLDADLLAIQNSFQFIKGKLPFVINLTPQERKEKGSYSRRPDSYAITSFEIATAEPQLVPATLDMAGWAKDLELLAKLTKVKQQLSQLSEGIDDTIIALRTETAKTSNVFLKTLKILAKLNVPGIDAMVDKLQAQMGLSKKKKAAKE